jgi:hypothetical protein
MRFLYALKRGGREQVEVSGEFIKATEDGISSHLPIFFQNCM